MGALIAPVFMIHGAMPTNGAATAYRNAHCGYDGGVGFVLGKNAAEVSAMLAFCQGGLELLPNHLYQTASPDYRWLKLYDRNKQEHNLISDYQGEKVYEFYEDTVSWFSLFSLDLLSPEKEKLETDKYQNEYAARVVSARVFWGGLGGRFHPDTTMYYSQNSDMHSYDVCAWLEQGAVSGSLSEWQIKNDDHNDWFFASGRKEVVNAEEEQHYQELQTFGPRASYWAGWDNRSGVEPQRSELQLAPPWAAGDETVHMGSGRDAVSKDGALISIGLETEENHQRFYLDHYVAEQMMKRIEEIMDDVFKVKCQVTL